MYRGKVEGWLLGPAGGDGGWEMGSRCLIYRVPAGHEENVGLNGGDGCKVA